MSITVTTPATSRKLTTRYRLRGDLEINSTQYDHVLDACIEEASDWVVSWTGREFAKERVVETLPAFGGFRMLLSRRPIIDIHGVTLRGTTVSTTTFDVEDYDGGILFRDRGWNTTQLIGFTITPVPTGSGKRSWSFDYTAGYVLPTTAPGSTETRTLPHDVERAALVMARNYFLGRGDNLEIERRQVGDAMEWRYMAKETGAPPIVVQSLQRWRAIEL